jgi:hypothetical protein
MKRHEAPERFEQLIAFLGSNLPTPVERHVEPQGFLRFVGGDPPEVIAILSDTNVEISEFVGVWETPLTFKATSRRVGTVKWRRLPENALLAAISALVKGAREARLASFQTCRYCGQRTAPEWLHDEMICQSCADQHSGAIH